MNTRRKEKLCTVYHVLVDGEGQGPAGDSTFIVRFRTESEANAFAAGKTGYGKPATVHCGNDVPRRIAERWGMC